MEFGLWIFLTLSTSALTVRVQPTNGIPRLLVDGTPVRPRIFFGAPGSAPLKLDTNWQQFSFTFQAAHSASNGTIHFRFGPAPGQVWLDDIVIEEVGSGRTLTRSDFSSNAVPRNWTWWPQGAANTVGKFGVSKDGGSSALHVGLSTPVDGKWPDFHIYHRPLLAFTEGLAYRVSFRARAGQPREITTALYRPGEPFVRIGGPPDVFARQIAHAHDAGVQFISFPTALPWPKPGEASDWSAVDESCASVLRANPDALLIPRIPMDPPRWWREAHPDDVMRFEDSHTDLMVVASPRYRGDASKRLYALVAHLEEKFGSHVAGYHPCGQNTGEWFYQDTWKRPLSGYASADREAWREWLAKRYSTDADLRRAWANTNASIANAAPPSPSDRHSIANGIFRDPSRERPLIDWADFQQEAMADCVSTLAHAAREASAGRKLVLFFYGYVFEFGAIENGPAVAGHYALRRVLDSPDIDILCSPISYFDRGLGGSAPVMSAAESVALAGKLWLNEDDTHTYLATGTQPGWMEYVNTVEETIAELTRNVAQESTRHFATWWMDLGATGWFDDPRLWQSWERLSEIDDPISDMKAFQPEVAAVIDERAISYLGASATVSRPAIYEARAALGRCGAPYGQYLLDDVLAGRVHARLYVFLNAWRLTPSQRQRLRTVTEGATTLWCYAPGLIDSNTMSVAAMSDLTGFTFRQLAAVPAKASPNAQGRALGLQKPLGVAREIKPLFGVSDANPEEVLATYSDGAAAVVLRQRDKTRTLFAGPPGLTSDLLRVAARLAGVHLFTTNDCVVFANAPFIALHGAADGPITLNTGTNGALVDLVAKQVVGSGPSVTIPFLKKGETRIFRVRSSRESL